MQNNQTENIQNELNNELGNVTVEGAGDMVPRQDLDKVVEELKVMRKQKAEISEELERIKAAPKESNLKNIDSIDAIVDAKFAERERIAQEDSRKKNLETAIAQFKSSNSQFNGDDGTKFSAVQNELNNFDLSKFNTVDEFESAIKKASLLAGVTTNTQKEQSQSTPTYTPTPGGSNGIGTDTPSDEVTLTDHERAIVRASGFDEAKAIYLKKSAPATFASIIK